MHPAVHDPLITPSLRLPSLRRLQATLKIEGEESHFLPRCCRCLIGRVEAQYVVLRDERVTVLFLHLTSAFLLLIVCDVGGGWLASEIVLQKVIVDKGLRCISRPSARSAGTQCCYAEESSSHCAPRGYEKRVASGIRLCRDFGKPRTSGSGKRTRSSRRSSRRPRPPWRSWESARALGTLSDSADSEKNQKR